MKAIGADTGGTFTDLVLLDGDEVRTVKVHSTPQDPSEAVERGLRALSGSGGLELIHGSTVGLNAMLTGEVAPTALVTNEGFRDLIEGVTYEERADEQSGRSERHIIEAKDPTLRPALTVTTKDGEQHLIALPVASILSSTDVRPGLEVEAGTVVAKKVRETAKTKDITGGLPRVIDLFEARRPRDMAVVSEIAGEVSEQPEKKGKRILRVTPEVGDPIEYAIPKGRHLTVHTGDFVQPGEPLTEGQTNPHDILKIKGLKALAAHMVNEVQEVYRLQGVKINDKHVETIVRQMLRRVRILSSGDSDFLLEDSISRRHFEEVNQQLMEQGLTPAAGEPQLLGITKASLVTDSWISAASFQETTKVLTQASLSGQVDFLRGLKENITVGRLIPAGTGIEHYKYLETEVDEIEGIPDDLLMEDTALF